MAEQDAPSSADGIIPRAIRQIFEYIQSAPQEMTFQLSVSYLEVYREQVRDLLDPSKINLSVREGKGHHFYVEVSRAILSPACAQAGRGLADRARAAARA